MKYSVFLIIVLSVGMSIFSYGEELYKNETVTEVVYGKIYKTVTQAVYEETYKSVYVDDKFGNNHFSSLNEAVKYVKDKGTIYLGKDIWVREPIYIEKSINIKSFPQNGRNIFIQNKKDVLFKLEYIDYFKMEGIHVSGMKDSSVIIGHAENIYVKENKFSLCYPISVTGGKDYNIYMEGNIIIDGRIEVKPHTGNNKINLINNTFKVKRFLNDAIVLKNMNLYGYDNTINCTSLVFEKGEEIEAYMKNNIFSGKDGTILIKADGVHMHFNKNKIFKDFKDAIYYSGLEKVDFTHNWWGSKNGPSSDIYKENIDVRYWALFEDFKRFEDDSYTFNDLVKACIQIGKTIDKENWIYNIKEDDRINLLDVIGVIREIE